MGGVGAAEKDSEKLQQNQTSISVTNETKQSDEEEEDLDEEYEPFARWGKTVGYQAKHLIETLDYLNKTSDGLPDLTEVRQGDRE